MVPRHSINQYDLRKDNSTNLVECILENEKTIVLSRLYLRKDNNNYMNIS